MRNQPRALRASKSLIARLAIVAIAVGSLLGGGMPAAHAVDGPYTYYFRANGDPNIMRIYVAVAGGTSRSLDLQAGLVATFPDLATLQAFTGGPGASTIACGRAVSPQFGMPSAYDPNDPHTAANAAKDMGAATYTAAGFTGQGVDIALIDTGVAPVGDLKNFVIHGPDFSLESQNPALAHNDTYGHGTTMASIIHAAAPQARIVSIKVGMSDGAVDMTQVKAAIDWVRDHRNSYGLHISVMNLSYGTVAFDTWTGNTLSKSVDRAWQDGISVIVADGNNGDLAFDDPAGGAENPAFNQNIITVGAIDSGTVVADNGNVSRYSDDKLAAFSANATRTNPRLPDVGAPGSHIIVNRVPNAAADNMVADDMCMPDDGTALMTPTVYPILGGGKYVKSSGTSEAAAFTSGAVALMQSRTTTLKTKPDVVKRLLKANAHSVPNGAKSVYGDGAIDLKAVYNASVPSSYSQNHDPMDSVYNYGVRYEAARGGFHLLDPKGTAVKSFDYCADVVSIETWTGWSPIEPEGAWLCGGIDIFGKLTNWYALDSAITAGQRTWTDTASGSVYAGDGLAWVAAPATAAQGGDANGFLTDAALGKVWPNITWADTNWANNPWSGFSPSNVTWDAAAGSWNSALAWRSPDGAFTGHSWRGNRWSGNRWSGNRWSGNRWSGNSWREWSYS